MADFEPKSMLSGLPAVMQKRVLEAQFPQVPKFREEIASALIHHDLDYEGWVDKLLLTDCPVMFKYDYLQLDDILQENCQDDDGLRKVLVSFSILVKYGVNLLKPQSTRPQGWASVSFSNAVFKDKVDSIKGSRLVLEQFGYKEKGVDSQSFPANTQPQVGTVSKVTADIVIGHAEINKYLNGNHPFPQKFEEILPVVMRKLTVSNSALMEMLSLDIQANSTVPTPPSNTWASGWTAFPAGQKTEKLKLNIGQTGEDAGQDANIPSEEDEGDCDICGRAASEWTCVHCDNKMLCTSCDDRWHSHPKRREHKRAPVRTGHKHTSKESGAGEKINSSINKKMPTSKFQPSSENAFMVIPPPKQKHDTTKLPLNTYGFVSLLPEKQMHQMGENVEQSSTESLPDISVFDSNREEMKIPPAKPIPGPRKTLKFTTTPLLDYNTIRAELEKITDDKVKIEKLDEHVSKFVEQISDNDEKISEIVRKTPYFTIESNYLAHCFTRDRLRRDQMLLQEYKNTLVQRQDASDRVLDQHLSELKSMVRPPPNTYNPPPRTPSSSGDLGTYSPQSRTPSSSGDLGAYIPHSRTPSSGGDLGTSSPFVVVSPPVIQPSLSPVAAQYEPGDLDLLEDYHVVKLPKPPHTKPSASPSKGYGRAWNCQHCTFENAPDTKVCAMCDKTSELVNFNEDNHRKEDVVKDLDLTELESKSGALNIAVRRAFIDEQEEEEKLLEEKRRAKEEFNRQERKQDLKKQEQAGPIAGESVDEEIAGEEVVLDNKEKELSSMEYPLIHQRPEIRIPPDNTAEDMWSIVDMNSDLPTHSLVNDVRKSLQNDLQARLKQIEVEKVNQNMASEGRKLVTKLKIAESNGYTIEEFKFACEMTPPGKDQIDWLKGEWENLLKQFIADATSQIKSLQAVYQGDFPKEVAKSSIMSAEGELEMAIDKGVTTYLKDIVELSNNTQDRAALKNALNLHKGNIVKAKEDLQKEQMRQLNLMIWESSAEEEEEELYDNIFQNELDGDKIKDQNIDFERKIRMVMVHTLLEWYKAEDVVRLWNNPDIPPDTNIEDVLNAVKNVHTLEDATTFLCQECEICYTTFPPRKIMGLSSCQCKVCADCLKQHFEVMITEKYVKDMTCPCCQMPDTENPEEVGVHFEFLENLLKAFPVSESIYDLYLKKLMEWNLMKDPHFRWCSHCLGGFIFQGADRQLKMICPHCRKPTCYSCKKPWEEQHDGIDCEAFQEWKEANDPEHQAAGLRKHLEENGIDCPKCSMRYSLAKGGCMHFTCTQCRHEFCCGCSQPFKVGKACKRLKSCVRSGLHCHHPRDCLYYLRDRDVPDLQKLLLDREVEFNTSLPPDTDQTPADELKCGVKEQKETTDGLVDELCGRSVPQNFAGLCEIHYKEYLVTLINKNYIDPVEIMNITELRIQLDRLEKKWPKQKKTESADKYKKKLMELVQTEIPMPLSKKRSPSIATIHLI